jgi:hypothetical protein
MSGSACEVVGEAARINNPHSMRGVLQGSEAPEAAAEGEAAAAEGAKKVPAAARILTSANAAHLLQSADCRESADTQQSRSPQRMLVACSIACSRTDL